MAQPDFKLDLKGLPELLKALEGIPKDLAPKILQEIAGKAGKIMVNQLKSDAPDSNSSKAHHEKTAQNIIQQKTPTGTRVGPAKKLFWLTWLEFGTKGRKVKGRRNGRFKGANRGSIRARPWIRKSQAKAIPTIIQYLQVNLEKIVVKAVQKRMAKVYK